MAKNPAFDLVSSNPAVTGETTAAAATPWFSALAMDGTTVVVPNKAVVFKNFRLFNSLIVLFSYEIHCDVAVDDSLTSTLML